TVSDVVGIGTTDPNEILPANAALVSGTKTLSLTNRTAGTWTITAVDSSDGSKPVSTSPPITVNAGAFAKLQLLAPGETAVPGTGAGKLGTPAAQTAGTAFSVTVNAVDANWNLVGTNDTVAISSSDTNAALPATTALVGGSKSLSVTLKTAGNATLTASDATHAGILANTSPAISVNPAAFVKPQLLAPGETAAPGTARGKTGTPSPQTAGAAFNVTVNAVDANWNVVNTNDTVAVTSSDANAALPANAALVTGTKSLSVTLKT